MKKLMTILVLFALCGTAMAVTGTSSAKEQFPLQNGENLDYINYKTNTEPGSTGLKYTVTGSINKGDGNRMGHVYFTTMSQADLNEYNRINNTNVQKVAVQFVGAQDEYSGTTNWYDWKVTEYEDYGIYLDTANGREYRSVKDYNNYFELDPGQDFGVYYKGTELEYNDKTRRYETINIKATSTEGYIGNYDKGIEKGPHKGENKITVYDYNEEGVIVPTDGYTYKKFMCLFPTTSADMIHWEFMLQTRLDDPKVSVRPEDVTEELPAASGQPLPGTLATLLIGGLCAKTLSKKNKKH